MVGTFFDNYHGERHNCRDEILVDMSPLVALRCRVPVDSFGHVREHRYSSAPVCRKAISYQVAWTRQILIASRENF